MDTAFVSDTGELVERVSTFEDDRSIRGIVILTAAETAPEPAEVDPTLRDLSVPVFGGVFPEILYEGEKYDTGAVVAGLSVEPSVTVVRGLSDEGTDVDAALPAYPGDATAFVLVDAYATRVEDFVGSLFNAYGVDISYVGGGAGTLAEEGRPCLFTGEGLLADAAVFATVDSPTSVGVRLDEEILLSLPELNEKLATACNRVVVQDQYETQYRELFEEAPVMFALTRDEGGDLVVADCNREFAETLGYDRAAIRGRPLRDFYTASAERALEEWGYEQALAGEFGTAERTLMTRSGRELSTLLRATPRRDRRGKVVGTNALFVDVTELKRRNQQLTVLNRILRHNIRNDLTAIDGYLEMAMELTDGEANERLSDIANRTRSLLSTTEVADRVRRSLDQTEVAEQDLGESVEVLVERAREDFPGASIDATVRSVPARATAALDYALWELIQNACEHAGDAPDIEVAVRKNGEQAIVTVTDNGPGIPEQERRILERGEETKLDHGSGLGLWLVYWVLESSGGALEFDCDDGTEVSVSLPLAESET
jgi:PAS domain S-box-containing protein